MDSDGLVFFLRLFLPRHKVLVGERERTSVVGAFVYVLCVVCLVSLPAKIS